MVQVIRELASFVSVRGRVSARGLREYPQSCPRGFEKCPLLALSSKFSQFFIFNPTVSVRKKFQRFRVFPGFQDARNKFLAMLTASNRDKLSTQQSKGVTLQEEPFQTSSEPANEFQGSTLQTSE